MVRAGGLQRQLQGAKRGEFNTDAAPQDRQQSPSSQDGQKIHRPVVREARCGEPEGAVVGAHNYESLNQI